MALRANIFKKVHPSRMDNQEETVSSQKKSTGIMKRFAHQIGHYLSDCCPCISGSQLKIHNISPPSNPYKQVDNIEESDSQIDPSASLDSTKQDNSNQSDTNLDSIQFVTNDLHDQTRVIEKTPSKFTERKLLDKTDLTIVIIEDSTLFRRTLPTMITEMLYEDKYNLTIIMPDKFQDYTDLKSEFEKADIVIMDNDLSKIASIKGDSLTLSIMQDTQFQSSQKTSENTTPSHSQKLYYSHKPIIIKNSSDGFTEEDKNLYDASFGKCPGSRNIKIMKEILLSFLA